MNPYFDGSMLGDGSLEAYKEFSARLRIGHTLAQEPYNNWLMAKMPEFNWGPTQVVTVGGLIEGRLVKGTQHAIRTRRSDELLVQKRRWYPQGTKCVPPDLILRPETMAVWFMDDGSFAVTKYQQVCYLINLYTTGFCRENVDLLRSMLLDQHGIKSSAQPQRKSGFCIAISGRLGVTKFLDLVRPIVLEVPTMHYKIDAEGKLAKAEEKHRLRA